jgi:hypothetical protein
MKERRGACSVFVGKREGKRPLDKVKSIRKDYIIMGLH